MCQSVPVTRRDATEAPTPSPVKVLFADVDFRRFWIAQVLYSGVNGTLRFTFGWLVVTLTDWDGAEGRVLIALGLGPMLLSLPAGAWSDRVDRKQLYNRWTTLSVLVLAVITAAIQFDAVTPVWAGVAAFFIGITLTINMPNLQAMVPLLVPKARLMNAVALQNGGGQAASFLGLLLAGVAIQLLGDAAGFGLLTLIAGAALLMMRSVTLPKDAASASIESGEGMVASMLAGARFGLGRDPLRTLLILAVMLGGSFAVMQASIPRVVKEVYGQEAGLAGLVLGSFGIGMLVSSALVSRRSSMRHGVNVARHVGIGLGFGQFALSLAPNMWVAMFVMVAWGLNAGVAMASHRTLMQTHTPPEMMGRVMGLMMLGFAGALPVGALVSSVLAPAIGPVLTMRTVGLVTMAITIPLTFRRSFLELR